MSTTPDCHHHNNNVIAYRADALDSRYGGYSSNKRQTTASKQQHLNHSSSVDAELSEFTTDVTYPAHNHGSTVSSDAIRSRIDSLLNKRDSPVVFKIVNGDHCTNNKKSHSSAMFSTLPTLNNKYVVENKACSETMPDGSAQSDFPSLSSKYAPTSERMQVLQQRIQKVCGAIGEFQDSKLEELSHRTSSLEAVFRKMQVTMDVRLAELKESIENDVVMCVAGVLKDREKDFVSCELETKISLIKQDIISYLAEIRDIHQSKLEDMNGQLTDLRQQLRTHSSTLGSYADQFEALHARMDHESKLSNQREASFRSITRGLKLEYEALLAKERLANRQSFEDLNADIQCLSNVYRKASSGGLDHLSNTIDRCNSSTRMKRSVLD